MSALYDYATVRYAGDPVRGEAVNVAVVVISPDGEARVAADAAATSRLRSIWPDFNPSAYRDFVAELRQVLGAERQLTLTESPRPSKASAETLRALGTALVNGFQISEPRRLNAQSLTDAVEFVYQRFVRAPTRPRPRRRHMTRHELRDLIARIFSTWAQEESGISVHIDEEIDGERAPHRADLIVYRDDNPEFVFFALPVTSGAQHFSSLVRDGLPTIVEDVRAVSPKARFFAVLPDDVGRATQNNDDSGERARRLIESYRHFLAGVPGLTVASVSEIEAEFEQQGRVAI